MHATITSDASFNRKAQIGTYAFWLAVNETRTKRWGKLKGTIKRPEEAEFKCILNALHTLVSMKVPGLRTIFINTDCLNVIHICRQDKKSIKIYRLSWGNELYKIYKELNDRAGAEIRFKHIKSHTHTDTKANYVNDWCDREAGAVMAKELAKIEMQNITQLAKAY